MSRGYSTRLLAATAAAALGIASVAGCAAVPDRAAAAAAVVPAHPSHDRGVVHLTAYTPDDGPSETVIVTGAIGDYGKGISVYPNGSVDPDHNSELSLQLSHGTFRLDIASLDKDFVATMLRDFPTDAATCSGSFSVTQQVPVIAGSGTGAYKGIGGSFTLTATLDEVDALGTAAQPCNGAAPFLSQAIVMTGPGTVTF